MKPRRIARASARKFSESNGSVVTGAGLALSLVGFAFLVMVAIQPAPRANADHVVVVPATASDVTICHATSSSQNPWNLLEDMPYSSYQGHFENNGSPKSGHETDFVVSYVDGGVTVVAHAGITADEDCDLNPPTQTPTTTATADGSATATQTATQVSTATNTPIPTSTTVTGKVRICHSTASTSNPYESIEVNDDAADGPPGDGNDHTNNRAPCSPPACRAAGATLSRPTLA